MCDLDRNTEWSPEDRIPEAAWEAVDRAAPDGDALPAPADQFRISDLAKWLDLCA